MESTIKGILVIENHGEMIESYRFGEIRVDGVRYTSDLIILPSGVKPNWWRREGHRLSLEDLEEVLREKPEILVIGTGYSGLMRVPKELIEHLRAEGIEVMVQRTGEAWKTYNQLSREGRRVAAALHLTC